MNVRLATVAATDTLWWNNGYTGASEVITVPETPTWAMMLAGLFNFSDFAIYRRRKRSGADLSKINRYEVCSA
jgi:hypothetical protein